MKRKVSIVNQGAAGPRERTGEENAKKKSVLLILGHHKPEQKPISIWIIGFVERLC
jgi:hypothetical protein